MSPRSTVTILAAGTALLLASCTSPPPAPPTIRFAASTSPEGKALAQAAADWASSRQLIASVTSLDPELLLARVRRDLKEGEGAFDVVMIYDTWFAELAAGHKLAVLSTLIRIPGVVKEDYVENCWNAGRYPVETGNQYGVPYSCDVSYANSAYRGPGSVAVNQLASILYAVDGSFENRVGDLELHSTEQLAAIRKWLDNPKPVNTPGSGVLHAWLLAIPGGGNIPAAVDFLSWSASPKAIENSRSAGILSARKDQLEVAQRVALDSAKLLPHRTNWLTIERRLDENLKKVRAGIMTPSRALDAVTAELDH